MHTIKFRIALGDSGQTRQLSQLRTALDLSAQPFSIALQSQSNSRNNSRLYKRGRVFIHPYDCRLGPIKRNIQVQVDRLPRLEIFCEHETLSPIITDLVWDARPQELELRGRGTWISQEAQSDGARCAQRPLRLHSHRRPDPTGMRRLTSAYMHR